MQCEILMIGSELLLGQIVDTNAAEMGRMLAENGINLRQKTTVGDNPERIKQALSDALDRAEVVLTSGGLGPTEDDITRECIAELLGRPLEFRQDLFDALAERFARFRFVMTENNRKQAFAPRGAAGIENPHGTAPGLIVEDARGTIVCMPGVPGELIPMLREHVIPYLRQKFGIEAVIHSRVLNVCGLGESRVDAVIGDLIRSQRNPTVGVLAYPDAVRVRITARAGSVAEADAMIDAVEAEVRKRLPDNVVGTGNATIEQAVDALLSARGWTLAACETNSGGMLARRMVTAGAQSFAGGIVWPGAFDTFDKTEALRNQFHADCVLLLQADPVGQTTFARFVWPGGVEDWRLNYAATDERSQIRIAVTALDHVRRILGKNAAV
ncbi:MAG TPA: CinA family nicotinamide mononucleotide deamidase-related protein [Candidatus Hydrogenedentes bacterium]|nr:CinA family nicotinamide mononucleotide deamidase-related protein [Candidatus Hydrogenedentota bacterium]HPC17571.1 CinA family nicotinamide mononucleotide deamidase-related protein [Candidatus Hydrogenedentota bacterium]HRT21456.1 CinA family nicotinamide mononucleotide deamidase-related protein [Candidatus Hydrogenedentota bacterium]HRT63941.1 CinA family nicotinamide mononucleotide deamidase-related protein [Candidatus Hydrogenedentota bacterium]